jgi:hypothetical protein
VSRLSDAEAISVLDQLVEQDADLVFLEANLFVVDFARRGGKPPATWSPKTWWSQNVGVPFRRGIERLRGQNFTVDLAAERLLNAKFEPTLAALQELYPLAVRGPSDPERFGLVMDRAKEAAIRVILVVPPRPRSVAQVMGAVNLAEVQAGYERLATTYGLELWMFGTTWPNDLFADHAHLNSSGRERFVAELRQRYQDAS